MQWTQGKIKKLGRLLVPLIFLLSCLLVFLDLSVMERIELKTLDLRFWIRGEKKPKGDVVIVAIDEKTVQAWGRWPPPRAKMAELTNRISAQAPKVIVFDIIFSEKELVAEGVKAKEKGDKAPSEEESLSLGDQAFLAAIQNAGNVVLPFALDVPLNVLSTHQESSELSKEVPDAILFSTYGRVKKGTSLTPPPYHAVASLAPLPAFAGAAAALGHVYMLPDRDGVLRRETLVVEYGGEYYPPMTLQAARLYLGLSETEMELKIGESVRLGKTEIQTDEIGRIIVDYFGKEKTYPYYSAADVVSGTIPSKLFEGKVVVIGASALATADSKVTPFSNNIMGFEKNATVIENIVSNRFFYRSEAMMKGITLGLIFLYALILWIVMPRFRALGGALWGGGLFTAHLLLATYLFIRYRMWIDMVYPSGLILGTYMIYTGFQYFTEEKKAREIRKMFQNYVSPRVVEEMVKRPELARLGGYKQEVTILFSDVRGFTVYCEERKERPDEVVSILNEYLGAMTDIVFLWEGTLDKFVGDAVMVFWGAPLPQEDHAWRAVGCAWQMRNRLAKLQEKWKSEGKQPLDIGIGINTGEVIVGNIGADGKKMDYTVIGDAVNLAARIESLTRKYEAAIIITDKTYAKISGRIEGGVAIIQGIGSFLIRELDKVKVKGKEETIPIYGITKVPERQKS